MDSQPTWRPTNLAIRQIYCYYHQQAGDGKFENLYVNTILIGTHFLVEKYEIFMTVLVCTIMARCRNEWVMGK